MVRMLFRKSPLIIITVISTLTMLIQTSIIGRRKVSRFSQLLNQNKLTLLSSNNLLI